MICRFHKLQLITRDKYLAIPDFRRLDMFGGVKCRMKVPFFSGLMLALRKVWAVVSAVMKQWLVTLLFMWLVLGRPTGICCPTRHIKPSISIFRWNFRSGTESALNQTVSFRLASLKQSSAERTVKFCHCLK